MRRRAHKYGAVKTVFNGITFDSKGEANRYGELKMMERAGLIADLQLQPEFVIQASFTDRDGKKHQAIKYRADFQYKDLEKDCTVVEDFKGVPTPEFRMKAKMFRFKFPYIDFRITK